MTDSPAHIVRDLLNAFVAKDREAAESLIAADFRFTSPYDNGLDRAGFFKICWPNSAGIQGFDIVRLLEFDDVAIVTYEGRAKGGKRFRNTEVTTCREGQAISTEVYFGWNVPHDVAAGQHSNIQ